MDIRDYIYSFILSLWCVVFLGTTEQSLVEAITVFETDLFDLIKAIVMGIFIGLVFRNNRVRRYLESVPFGKLTTGNALGIVGLGSLGIGIFGAIIVYLKFENIELIQLPLHAALVGLSALLIYLTMHWRKRDI